MQIRNLLLVLVVLASIGISVARKSSGKYHGDDVTSTVLYAQDFIVLFILMGMALAKRRRPEGFNDTAWFLSRTLFYIVLLLGVFFWYWHTSIDWYRTVSTSEELTSTVIGSDTDGEHNLQLTHLYGVPRLGISSSFSGELYAATWLLMVVGYFLFLIEEVLASSNGAAGNKGFSGLFWNWWGVILGLAVAVHIVAIIFLFIAGGASNIAAWFYVGAALILFIKYGAYAWSISDKNVENDKQYLLDQNKLRVASMIKRR